MEDALAALSSSSAQSETKIGSLDDVDEGVALIEGYESYWSSSKKRKGWSGVATFARKGVTRYAEEGFGDPRFNDEGRVVMTDHDAFVLFNVYVPNGQKGDVDNRLAYKLAFLESFLARIQALRRGEIDAMGRTVSPPKPRQVIVVGDINIVHWEEDIWLPRKYFGVTAFLNVERRMLCRWVRTYLTQRRVNDDGQPSEQMMEELKQMPQYGSQDQRSIQPAQYPSYSQRIKDLFDDKAEERELPYRILHQRMRNETPTRGRGASLDIGNNIGGSGRRSVGTKTTYSLRTVLQSVGNEKNKRVTLDSTLTLSTHEIELAQSLSDGAITSSSPKEDEKIGKDSSLNYNQDSIDDSEVDITEEDILNVSVSEKETDPAAQCKKGESPPPIWDVPLLDVFRTVRPLARHAYSCWNVVRNYRPINLGVRIDYIFATEGIAERIINAQVLQGVFGSDHCPVIATVSLLQKEPLRRKLRVDVQENSSQFQNEQESTGHIVGSPILSIDPDLARSEGLWARDIPPLAQVNEAPKLCAKYYPKFNRKQTSLRYFFKPQNQTGESGSLQQSKSISIKEAPSMGDLSSTNAKELEEVQQASLLNESASEQVRTLAKAQDNSLTLESREGKEKVTISTDNNNTSSFSSSSSSLLSTDSTDTQKVKALPSLSPWSPISFSGSGEENKIPAAKQTKGTILGFIRK